MKDYDNVNSRSNSHSLQSRYEDHHLNIHIETTSDKKSLAGIAS